MTEKFNPQEAVDFVMPDGLEKRQNALLPLLDIRPPRSPLTEGIEALPQPAELQDGIRFDYTYDDLVEIAKEVTPGSPEDIQRVIRYGLVWSGMNVGSELSHWATTDHGYENNTRLPRVTLPVHNKRLSVRAVPNAWTGPYGTPFTLRKSEQGPQIVATKSSGEEVSVAQPSMRYVTESVQTIAYVKDITDGSKDITINPKQRCPQKCEFCCRGYHNMTLERKRELIDLSPDEMTRYLQVKFPKLQWEDVARITVVTGDFLNDQAVLEYMEGFNKSMATATEGKWDPVQNPGQDLSVSTHLFQTRETMEHAKALGMGRFLFTAEMSDDDRREAVMYVSEKAKGALNKGHTPFKGVLKVLRDAIEVFGEEAVEPVLVVGLDSLDKTRESMDSLKAIGVKRVSRALFNLYHMNQFGMLQPSFPEAVEGMQYARDLFSSAHSRIVTGDNPAASSPELYA